MVSTKAVCELITSPRDVRTPILNITTTKLAATLCELYGVMPNLAVWYNSPLLHLKLFKFILYCRIMARLTVATAFSGFIAALSPAFAEAQLSHPNKHSTDSITPVNQKLPAENAQTLYDVRNLKENDYRSFTDQLYYQAAQDYDRWLKLGQPEDFHNALFHINSAVEINPDAAKYLFFQGMLYASLKADPVSLAQATDSFLSVLELQPDHRQARFALAQVLQEQGKFRLAAEQYQLLLEAYPEMVTGLVLAPLGFCYLAGNNLEFGLNYLKNLSRKHPKSASLRTTLAVLLQNSSRSSEADNELKQILHGQLGTKSEQEFARLLQARWQAGGKP